MTSGPYFDAQTAYDAGTALTREANGLNTQEAEVVGEEVAWTPKRLLKISKVCLFSLLLILPVCFGGVHSRVYLPAHMVIFAIGAIYSFYFFRLKESFAKGSPSYWILMGLLAYIGFSFFQGILFSFTLTDHPVLGKVSRLVNPGRYWGGIEELLFFVCAFFIVRAFIEIRPKNFKRLSQVILLSGFIVSLIGLSHWFYDNGKLFWTYEPESLLISTRARWPFVNPNHLAHFLLLLFFLGISNFFVLYREIRTYRKFNVRGPAKILSRLATSDRLRSRFVGLSYLGIMGFTVLLCIFGTLSRGGWLGLSLGTIMFLLGVRSLEGKFKSESKSLRPRIDKPKMESRRKRRYRDSEWENSFLDLKVNGALLVKGFGVLFAVLVLYFFLQGRGAELVEARIEFGLKYSKDDMRWQFYSDTLAMIKENPLFGVGLGAWSTIYPKYMHISLSGINPVHLHSEPLSALAESGAIGVFPLLFVFFFVTFSTFHALKMATFDKGLLTLGLYTGLFAFLIASLLDFPLRMPAISFLMAVELAMLSSCLDPSKEATKTEPVS